MISGKYDHIIAGLREEFRANGSLFVELAPSNGAASLVIHAVPDGISYLFRASGIVDIPRFACAREEVLPYAIASVRRAARRWLGLKDDPAERPS